MQQTSNMENSFWNVMEDQKTESQPGEIHNIGSCHSNQINGSISDPGWHVFSFDFLEVEFWVEVKPVGNLNDKEKFEEECHVNDRVIFPESWNVCEKSFT